MWKYDRNILESDEITCFNSEWLMIEVSITCSWMIIMLWTYSDYSTQAPSQLKTIDDALLIVSDSNCNDNNEDHTKFEWNISNASKDMTFS